MTSVKQSEQMEVCAAFSRSKSDFYDLFLVIKLNYDNSVTLWQYKGICHHSMRYDEVATLP